MMTIPLTRYTEFKESYYKDPHLRTGQAFHHFMRLDKIQGEDKQFCDRLYQLDGVEAEKAILSRLDYEN